jgi:hypothetical protein
MNMADVIVPKSDQINADDLIGRDMTITIRDVQIRGGQEQPVSIFFEGSDKAFRPCKSMSRVLVAIWGADARQYIGRSLTLYRDPTVKWGGMEVGGIRISHMSDMEKPHTMALTATKGARKPYTVKPLTNVPAARTDKVADGVRTLIARINSVDGGNLANVIDDPAVVKQRAWLATNRPELAAEVDTAIAAKQPDDEPFSGPSDPDRGEKHSATEKDDATEATILAGIEAEKTRDALDSYMARVRGQRDGLDDAANERISDAYNAKWGGLPE